MAENDPTKVCLDKPLSEMSTRELLAWGAKQMAGGVLGAVGAGLLSPVLNELFAELNGRQKSVSDLLREQLGEYRDILKSELQKAALEDALEACRIKANALQDAITEYRNASPADPLTTGPEQWQLAFDRLSAATTNSYELIEALQSPRLGTAGYQTFQFAAGLRLQALQERVNYFKKRQDTRTASGEEKNIKDAASHYYHYSVGMLNDWKESMQAPVGSVTSDRYTEVVGHRTRHGNDEPIERHMMKWWFHVDREQVIERLVPFGWTGQQISDRYSHATNYRQHTGYDIECVGIEAESNDNQERALRRYAEERQWLWHRFLFDQKPLPAHNGWLLITRNERSVPYLHPPINEFIKMWKIISLGQENDGEVVIIVPYLRMTALFTQDGIGTPSFTLDPDEHDHRNLWLLRPYGPHVMIIPLIRQTVALDAHGGHGPLYFQTNVRVDNPNLMWEITRIDDGAMIRSRVRNLVLDPDFGI
jgi:hypothetical protein